ncbi:2-hydroxymuconate tautomerase [Pelagibius sp. Alg239-R121]|uniref:2-hydroxymuconate tautomerase n=1 Tax=Pelagibius sp. Alg239-R121 TaxID=2993448 RepID=UPI0024A65B2C|nr:2-hydroxymuconate tautomerase [Pelagibius sp. Alg239-R121]
MPIIRVEMFKGRTQDQKRELVRELTEGFVRACGGNPESLHVVITDVEKEDWGTGGQLCVDKYPDK